MDWIECSKKDLIKKVNLDEALVLSLMKSSQRKSESQALLPLNDTTKDAKITLLYDALRELLEALAIRTGYKIYNHECYCAFLSEILKKSELSETFNYFRKIRNSINYYGKEISLEEVENLLKDMLSFIVKIKIILKNKK